ncbi:MAG: FAD-binding oxidoreductase [Gammaproteobacteria bacterium]|nr:FAD-binding oxidoreductase [Gammaproteobacteria bacterium]
MVMRRRTFIKAAGGVAAGALAFGQEPSLSIGIVGGGIIGASVALHLSAAGADVTLFEKEAPAAGATGKSFAWINAHTNDPHYRALRMKSIAAYRELDRALGLDVMWGGAITWVTSLAEAEQLKASSREFSRDGYDSRVISVTEMASLVPNVRLGAHEAAIFNAMDGHIDPVSVTKKMLAKATEQGALLVHPCDVTELRFVGNRLLGVDTTSGEYALDRLVIAGGTDTPSLASQAGFALPLKHAPGILLHTTPQAAVLSRVMESPGTYFKQNPDGRIVGSDAPYAPDLPVHVEILRAATEMPAEIRAMHGERILGKVSEMMPGVVDARYDFLTLGYRPLPEDGLPVAGPAPDRPDVYVAVMHSGVTLAPIMGRYITQELLTGVPVDELAPYRPGRFRG